MAILLGALCVLLGIKCAESNKFVRFFDFLTLKETSSKVTPNMYIFADKINLIATT